MRDGRHDQAPEARQTNDIACLVDNVDDAPRGSFRRRADCALPPARANARTVVETGVVDMRASFAR